MSEIQHPGSIFLAIYRGIGLRETQKFSRGIDHRKIGARNGGTHGSETVRSAKPRSLELPALTVYAWRKVSRRGERVED